jgi:hypothetical protein
MDDDPETENEAKLPVKGPKKDKDEETGVRINLISSRKLDSMSSEEKLRFILDEVKRGSVLVLERGLTAVEEIDLIKSTMSEIDHQTFIGIEMQSYSSDDVRAGSWFSKLLGRTNVPRMSVIGPANLLKTIQKDGNMIQAMILTGKSIMNDESEDTETQTDQLDEASKDNSYGDDESADFETGTEAPLAIPVTNGEEDDAEKGEEDNPENENDKEEGVNDYQETILEQHTLYEILFSSPPPLATRVEIKADNDNLFFDSGDIKILPKLSELPEDIKFKNKENIISDIENSNDSNESTTFLYKRLKSYYEE